MQLLSYVITLYCFRGQPLDFLNIAHTHTLPVTDHKIDRQYDNSNTDLYYTRLVVKKYLSKKLFFFLR